MNDRVLQHVVKRARLVVVVSREQQRWLKQRYANVATAWVPVAADIRWWKPGPAETDVLTRLHLEPKRFLLSVGDIDRDEQVAIRLSQKLGMPLVRVTKDPRTAARAEEAARLLGAQDARCLLKIPFTELRDLHRTAWAMLNAPTVTYHPAGLTTLTESMACGGVVLFPKGPTTEGYIEPQEHALTFDEMSVDSVMQACEPIFNEDRRQAISTAARRRCEDLLNFSVAGKLLAEACRSIGLDRPPHAGKSLS
jgi:hypothetical protein